MELQQIKAAVEGVLFTMGDAVPLNHLAQALEQDEDTLRKIMQLMMDEYESEERGIQIIEVNGAYQMCTKASVFEPIIRVVKQPKRHILSDVVLETLSIIAYKQPITKQEIEAIRGVKSDHAVNKLVEYRLVEEIGRLDAIGRPILFGTTMDFLRSFGVASIEELPVIAPAKVEGFKQEAEEEAQLTLNI